MLKRIDENVLLASPRFTKQKEYWMNKFSKDITITGIPHDRNQVKPELQQEPAETGICFPGHLCKRMIQFSKASDLSLYILLLTGTKLLIYGCTGNRSIDVFSPLYQPHINAQTINNCVLICSGIPGSLSFIEFLLMTRQSVLEAYENQDYPHDKLLEHVLDGSSTQHRGWSAGISCSLKNIHPENNINILEAKLSFLFSREEAQIKGTLRYDPNLYTDEFARQLARHLARGLENALENVNIKISGISFLSEEEKSRLIFDFNNTGEKYPKNKPLQQLFEAQVERTPNKIALAGSSRYALGQEGTREFAPLSELMSITYKELNEKSHGLAHLLRTRGIKPDMMVGIMLEPSTEMIAGILGILKAGGAYLPIDPGYPEKRIKYMLDDAAAPILLTRSGLMLKTNYLSRGECIRLDRLSLYPRKNNTILGINRWDHLAYIMYTSGSTGRAKGVMVNHRNVIRLVVNTNYAVLTEETRILQTGAPAFDATTFEIWGALLNGGTLYLATNDVILDANQMGQAIVLYKINTLWLTSPLFNQLAYENCRIFSPLEQLLVGGDVLSPKYINMVRNRNETLKIINGYGPTENTTFSTTFLIDRDFNSTIPIGTPIRNSTAYIFDKNHRLQPIGVLGELYVGGDGVSRGYLNRIELTAERFIKDPFSGGKRLYRTGDMARWLTDGTIEFSGRIDNQVKIRGFRIELEEIESKLLSYHQVEETIVLAKERDNREKYLCAYLVTKDEIPISQLREHLLNHLPGYIIPSYFVFLAQMPLTPNGKIDRKSLPEPEKNAVNDHHYIAPRDALEEKLAEILASVLKVEKNLISIDANFFHLGANSLNAIRIISSIHKTLNIKITLAEIFVKPTIRELSGIIRGVQGHKYMSIDPAEKREYYSLSSAQKRLYFLQQLNLASTSYNIPQVVSLAGYIKIEKLEEIFRRLISRHESLRTSFKLVHEEPVQLVHDKVNFDFDLPGFDPDFLQQFICPFDLSRAPLLRVNLIKKQDSDYLLVVDMHHIISDGVSQSILIEEFISLYQGEELPKLRLQYKDYSEWLGSKKERERIKQQEAYWLREFAAGVPVLNIPCDYPRPVPKSFEGKSLGFEISEEKTKALKEITLEEGTTMYVALLAIYTIFLSKISGQDDIVVGTSTSGRTHADLEKLIGMFVNTLALRNYPKANKTFNAFIQEANQRTIKAFDNQEYQFEKLVEKIIKNKDIKRNPIFDVRFIFDNIEKTTKKMPGVKANTPGYTNTTSKFDMTWAAYESGEKLYFGIEYCTKLFKEDTIKRFIDDFKGILSTVINNKNIQLKDIAISHDFVSVKSKISHADLDF
jgi:tyrocidine synthetase-3